MALPAIAPVAVAGNVCDSLDKYMPYPGNPWSPVSPFYPDEPASPVILTGIFHLPTNSLSASIIALVTHMYCPTYVVGASRVQPEGNLASLSIDGGVVKLPFMAYLDSGVFPLAPSSPCILNTVQDPHMPLCITLIAIHHSPPTDSFASYQFCGWVAGVPGFSFTGDTSTSISAVSENSLGWDQDSCCG